MKKFEHAYALVTLPNFVVYPLRVDDKGQDVEESNIESCTMLTMACLDNRIDYMHVMLKNPGTRINWKDDQGANVFYHACKRQNMKIAEFLLTFKAGREKRCMVDATPLDKEDGMNALHWAVHLGFAKIVSLIIDKAKENMLQTWDEKTNKYAPLQWKDLINSSKRNGVTTLQLAIIVANTDMVKLLTKKGADVNKKDPITDVCPLYLAIKMKSPT